ncbi:hypothetical protein Tco_1314052 [Tanacetum coccineum]
MLQITKNHPFERLSLDFLAQLEVTDVPEYISESKKESLTYNQGEDDEDNDEQESENNNDDEDDDQENVSGETELDNDKDDFVHPNLSTYKADDQEEEKEEEKGNDDEDVSSDQMVSTPPDYEITEEEENQKDDVDVSTPNIQYDIHVNVLVSATTETPSSDTTIPQPPIPIIQPQQQTHDSTTTTTLPEMPNFASLFGFERRVSLLKTELFELKQTNQFAEALSSIPGIFDNYLASKMKDAVNVIDSNIKAIIKDQVKAQVSKSMPKVEKYVTESLGAEVLARSFNQPQTSYATAASLSEFELKKILIDKIEENKSMNILDIQKNLYNTLIESYNSEKDLFASYGDPKERRYVVPTGRVLSPEATQKESKSTSSSKGASRSQQKSSGKSAQAEEHGPRVDDLEEPLHQEFNT